MYLLGYMYPRLETPGDDVDLLVNSYLTKMMIIL